MDGAIRTPTNQLKEKGFFNVHMTVNLRGQRLGQSLIYIVSTREGLDSILQCGFRRNTGIDFIVVVNVVHGEIGIGNQTSTNGLNTRIWGREVTT